MSSRATSPVTFRLISSPLLVTGGAVLLLLLLVVQVENFFHPILGPWGRALALLPLFLIAFLIGLEGIQRVEIGADGIGVISLAGLLLSRLFRFSTHQADRSFRLPWSSVDAVELKVPRYQSPFRRAVPRGWLAAGSAGRMIYVPFGHPCFGAVLKIIRQCVHPYFLHLPSRRWEGEIPARPALTRMLRTIVYDPGAPPEFITRTAQACLLWSHFARAERLMDLALAKSQEDPDLLEDYYLVMKRLGNLEKAKPVLLRLLQSRSLPLDLVEMAELHLAEGREKEAAERLLQAAGQDQTSALAHFLLGHIYLHREGLEETALDQWQKGMEQARDPHVQAKLGETYRYHRDLLTKPGFVEGEHRRVVAWIWSRRLGGLGVCLVLAGMALWWFPPGSGVRFPGISGSLLSLGGALMLAALFLRRRGRP